MRRVVAGLALAAAAVLVLALVRASDVYTVRARFPNASQLVKGNLVTVAGERVGTVRKIEVSRDWQADVTLELTADDLGPLRTGTRAVIRQASLSGVANRYVDLEMPGGRSQQTIPSGGTIPTTDTQSVVEFDQLFSALGPRERKGLQDLVQGNATSFQGRSKQLSRGLEYLAPTLSANDRLFSELVRDTPGLERFVVESAALAGDVAERRDDLAGVVTELADFLGALARRRSDLGETIDRLPPFFRRANTTFVNLRATLDDLTPLLRESRPVAERLGPLLDELRPFASEARPTLRDLALALTRPGSDNDLVDLTRSNVPLRAIAVGPVERNGTSRPGALPVTAQALRGSVEPVGFLRPYTPDLLGWFDDFSVSGATDAFGAFARIGLHANAFTLIDGVLVPVPPELRDEVFNNTATLGQLKRCPGAAEHAAPDGSNAVRPTPDFDCDPTQRLPGD